MNLEPTILVGDWLEVGPTLPDNSVDLVICSPPYDAARTYGIDFGAKGEGWVEWAKPRFRECLRVCKGLVAWVVEGTTEDFSYSCSPFLLMADLKREGVTFRKPPAYRRVGIPGSGGPDWLRNDWEPILCATKGGKLPWSDNVACGKPPVFGPGGPPSHRKVNGDRVGPSQEQRARFGSHRVRRRMQLDGELPAYTPPELANPGNVIDCVVGGGKMGDDFANENEAPFPEPLVEFFVKSFCRPDGTVLDCFMGSGTTLKVARALGRNSIGVDIRQSQADLAARRLAADARPLTFRDMTKTDDAPLFAGTRTPPGGETE